MFELADKAKWDRTVERLVAGIGMLRDAGVNTVMYYWPDDEFVKYDSGVRRRLEQVGVNCRTLDLDFPTGSNPFVMHSEVARHQTSICALNAYLDTVFT